MTERNAPDRRDEEVRSYVRHRMADDLPPEFMGDVMTDVRQTDQRRRGSVGWPLLAGLATVAAAVVLVFGLGLLQREDVGASPTASARASESETATESASASASASASSSAQESPSADPTTAEGAFGPTHSMTPEEAFGEDAQTCENRNAVVNGEPTDITFSVSYPADWYTNDPGAASRGLCAVFGPEPFDPGPQSDVLASAAITLDIPFGGDFDPTSPSIESGGLRDPIVTTEEFTVAGVAALRYEYPAQQGFPPSVIWIVAVEGNLPAVGNDRPYLFFAAPGAFDPERNAEINDILDRMVATLDIGQ